MGSGSVKIHATNTFDEYSFDNPQDDYCPNALLVNYDGSSYDTSLSMFSSLHTSEFFTDVFYIRDSKSADYRDCDVGCKHYLDGCLLQLKPCSFYKEAYCRPTGVDFAADFIYGGVLNGFDIVDNVHIDPYYCSNYSSILDDTVFWEIKTDY